MVGAVLLAAAITLTPPAESAVVFANRTSFAEACTGTVNTQPDRLARQARTSDSARAAAIEMAERLSDFFMRVRGLSFERHWARDGDHVPALEALIGDTEALIRAGDQIIEQAGPSADEITLSVAGYEGEVMRGAFKGVPHGQLEAAKAMGMPRLTLFRRIWLPQALHRVLPTLGGETVLQLKATPLVAMITVTDIYAVSSRVRAETLIVYEPLLMLAIVYLAITGMIVALFTWFERRVPSRTA